MKLVEILARELGEWPERSSGREWIAITQDGDGELNYCPTPNPQFDTAINQWLADGGVACDGTRAELADDHSAAIITRADWEAERARIKGDKAMPKPNKDGWIRHRGGKCPVEADAIVEVRLRDGTEHTGDDAENGDYWVWHHSGNDGDIMAWRPHKAEQVIVSDAGVLTDGLREPEMPAAEQDGPLQWRDRIHTIDFDKAAAQKTHEAAMAALDSERTSLVAKLKAEGFALIQGDEPNTVVESAQQDMSDWRNWEKGDILLCVKADCYPSELTTGKLYPYHGDGYVIDDGGAEQGYPIRFGECFKWHSRPTT